MAQVQLWLLVSNYLSKLLNILDAVCSETLFVGMDYGLRYYVPNANL